MRHLIRIASCLGLVPLLAGTAATPLQGQEVKLGFIDSRTIIEEAPGAKEAQEELDQQLQRYRAQVQQMGDELQQMIESFEQQQLTLSPEAKKQRRQEIEQKQQEYQRKVQQLESQAAQRQQELVEPIMNRINGVIDQIRREGEYTMIFDVSAGAIIAADPALDLTSQVIRRLKETTPRTASPDTTGSR